MATRNGRDPEAWVRQLVERSRPGYSLEQPFYTDPDVFALDLERVTFRHWQYAGHVSRLSRPGDYFLYDLAGESLVILRGHDGPVRAFFNVCRHRGSRVCLEEAGTVKKLVCPYHAWVYDTDGRLAACRHMPADFDKSAFGLHPCHVRVVEGLIFVCLADEPPDFEPVFRDIEYFLGPHGLSNAKVCHRSTHRVRANWKLVAENFWECYHCTHTHPEFCAVMSYARAADSESLAREQEAFVAEWEARARSLGHRTGRSATNGSSAHHAARVPIRPGYVTQSEDGKPVAPLMGSFRHYDGGISAIQAYPLLWFVACNDHAMLSRFTPVGPAETEAELSWLVRADAVEGVDYDVGRVTWLWTRTGAEDWKICEDNQAGVNSRRYRPGPYAPTEAGAQGFVTWYLKQLAS